MTKKQAHTERRSMHADHAPEPDPAPQADGAVEAVPPASPVEAAALGDPAAPSSAVVDELNDKYLRLAAEYDNFRRRTAKERIELTARAQGDLLKMLIDPLDDLARVIAQGPGASDAKTVLDAVEVVDKKMMKGLIAAGLEIINPVGQPFDPTLHEAVSTAPAPSADQDHIVSQVFQPGYLFKGQLLRAARVVVLQWNG